METGRQHHLREEPELLQSEGPASRQNRDPLPARYDRALYGAEDRRHRHLLRAARQAGDRGTQRQHLEGGGTTGTAYTVNINTSSPPLDDVRVRQALAYALDRNVELKVAFNGVGKLAASFWGPGSEWNCPDVGYPEYDPEKAKTLLKDYGKPVKVVLQSQPTPSMTTPAQLYQSFWQKVGIETEIKNIQGGPSYINPVLRGDYQIVLWEVADVPDPDFQVYQAFFSKSGGNLTKINDPKLDEAIETGRRSLDIDVRKQAYCDVSKEMAKQMPICCASSRSISPSPNAGTHSALRRGVVRLNEVWVDRNNNVC